MSGAGKSTAMKMMEDMGYFCIDNLPIQLLDKLIDFSNTFHSDVSKVAVGIDVRNGSGIDEIPQTLEQLRQKNFPYEILFLDAEDEVLVKRYKETRRNHPLAGSERINKGIVLEREKLQYLKDNADYIIDTSQLHEFYNRLDTKIQYEDAMVNCLSTPGDIKTYINIFDNCYEYVQLVYTNILKVRTGNAFKISNKIDFKEVNEVITPKLFLSVFLEYLRRRLHNPTVNDAGMVDIFRNMIYYTNQALIQLNKKGANKKMIFDIWVLNIRTLR